MSNFNDEAGELSDEEVSEQEYFAKSNELSTKFYEPNLDDRYASKLKGSAKEINDDDDGIVAGDEDSDDELSPKKKVTVTQILLLFSVLFVEIIVMLITFFPAELAMIYSGPFEHYLAAFVPMDEIESKEVVTRRDAKKAPAGKVSLMATPATKGVIDSSNEGGEFPSSEGDANVPVVVEQVLEEHKRDEALIISPTISSIVSQPSVLKPTSVPTTVKEVVSRKQLVIPKAKKTQSEKLIAQKDLEGQFFVQIAAVRRRSQAEALVRSFKGKGLVLRMEKTISKGLTLYRVVSLPLSKRKATEFADKLVRDNLVAERPFMRKAE